MIRWLLVAIGLYLIYQNRKIQRTQESIMATQQDVLDALSEISTELTKVATEQQSLIEELKNQQNSPAPDWDLLLSKAQGIAAQVQSIDALVPDAPAATNTPTA